MYTHVKVTLFLQVLRKTFLIWFQSLVKVAWIYSWSVTEVYFATTSRRTFFIAFERILMTYSFLERIGKPAVDRANDQEESVPFNVLAATFILDFSSSQIVFDSFRWLTWFKENRKKCFDAWRFIVNFFIRNWLYKAGKGFKTLANGWVSVWHWYMLYAWLRREMMYSLWDYIHDFLAMLLAFKRILDCRLLFWDDFSEASYCLNVFLPISARVCFDESIFLMTRQKFLRFGSIRV